MNDKILKIVINYLLNKKINVNLDNFSEGEIKELKRLLTTSASYTEFNECLNTYEAKDNSYRELSGRQEYLQRCLYNHESVMEDMVKVGAVFGLGLALNLIATVVIVVKLWFS